MQSAQQPPKIHKNVSVTKISLSTNNTPQQSTLKTPDLFKGQAEPMVNLLKKKAKPANSQTMFKIPFHQSKTARSSPVKELKDAKHGVIPMVMDQSTTTKKVANLISRKSSVSGFSAKSGSKSPSSTARPTIKQLLGSGNP